MKQDADITLPYPKVVSVACRPDYHLSVRFANGEHGVLDMRPYLDFGIFSRLRAVAVFQSVRVVYGTLAWGEQIDLDPAWVYKKTVIEQPEQCL